MAGSFGAKPLWHIWGPANACYASLGVDAPFKWADGSTDTLAKDLATYLLPENAPELDRTLSDYVIVCYQRPGARPLYAVRLKDEPNIDSLLTAVVGAVNWAPIRWVTRNLATDWEAF